MTTRNMRFKTKLKAQKMSLCPEMMTPRQREILKFIATKKEGCSGPELAEYFLVRNDSINEHVGALKIFGLVVRIGHASGSRFCTKENEEACRAALEKHRAESKRRYRESQKQRKKLGLLGPRQKKVEEIPDEPIVQRVVSVNDTKIVKPGPASVFELAGMV